MQKLYSLGYSNVNTYIAASLFVVGNILLPQLCHLVNLGGPIFLPIYFFTLVGAYKYGWKVGLLTAVASPLVNSLLFGMPSVEVIPSILLKSVVLALVAGYVAHRFRQVSLLTMVAVVLSYQVIGTVGEWIMGASLYEALQDFRLGILGMAFQIFGGYLFIKGSSKNSLK